MKKIFLLLLSALLGGFVTTNTVAGDDAMQAGSATKFDQDYINKVVPVSQVYNDLVLIGTITQLDRETGDMTVRTEVQGDVALQFEPTMLEELQVGDAVVVQLGFGIDERAISTESCSVLPVKVATC